jgi:hypothetical protein
MLALGLKRAVQRHGLAAGRHAKIACLLHGAAGGRVKGVHAGGLPCSAAGNAAALVDAHFHLYLEVAMQARRRTPLPAKLLEGAGNIAVVGSAAGNDACSQRRQRIARKRGKQKKRRKRGNMMTCGHSLPESKVN